MKRGLLALQFWDGDKEKAMRLARFIADLEPTHRSDVDFLFVSRFDSSHDQETIDYVSRKFEVRTMKTRACITGHPAGCWGLWFGAVDWFYQMREGGKIPAYQWIFPFEADCVPIRQSWITDCADEFDRANACIFGSETFHWHHHINGNLMVTSRPDFLRWLSLGVGIGGVPLRDAWDIYLFPKFARWGVGFSKNIHNCCGKQGCSTEEFNQWLKEGKSFIHGEKKGDVFNLANEALLGRRRFVVPPALTKIL